MQEYELLEQDMEEWSGCRLPTAVCNSGTTALHLALEALSIPQGVRVLVPEYTFVACARAVTMAGMEPVFIDVCRDDLTLNPELIREACDKYRVRVVMVVHPFGRQAQMTRVAELNDDLGFLLLEDLAEAHGLEPNPATHASCWSFFRNKVIAAEEGGALASRHPSVISKAKSLRSQGYRDGAFWNHEPRGINGRMTNAQAAIIRRQLGLFDTLTKCRRRTEEIHEKCCPEEFRMVSREVPWLYDLRIPGLRTEQQAELVSRLNSVLYARPGFRPVSFMDEYRNCMRVGGSVEAVRASREVIALDCSPTLDNAKIGEAWDIIKAFPV